MIHYIPSVQKTRIEREVPFLDDSEDHPSVRLNQQAIEENEQRLAELHSYCHRLQMADSVSWNKLADALRGIYSASFEMNRAGPVMFMKEKVPAEYWNLYQSYLKGQLSILSSMCASIQIDLDRRTVEDEEEVRITWGDFIFNYLLDRFRKVCYWFKYNRDD